MTGIRLLAAALLAPAPLLAHEFEAGDLTIDHPMAFATAPTAMAGGGYMTIANAGSEPDRLLEVRADFPRVELHATEERDGVARMRPVEALEIPPGETVELRPGGLHVMFMGLDGDPLEAGEEIPATLVFERAGEVDVVFHVEARDGDAASGHDGHAGHSDDMEM